VRQQHNTQHPVIDVLPFLHPVDVVAAPVVIILTQDSCVSSLFSSLSIPHPRLALVSNNQVLAVRCQWQPIIVNKAENPNEIIIFLKKICRYIITIQGTV
jgi:hypothetical protein